MGFLLKWLNLRDGREGLRLRPRREVVIALPFVQAFHRCARELTDRLGANVYVADEREGVIEAGFGLVRSERVRCSLAAIDAAHTRASIEAVRPAGVPFPERSTNVDVLADALERGVA